MTRLRLAHSHGLGMLPWLIPALLPAGLASVHACDRPCSQPSTAHSCAPAPSTPPPPSHMHGTRAAPRVARARRAPGARASALAVLVGGAALVAHLVVVGKLVARVAAPVDVVHAERHGLAHEGRAAVPDAVRPAARARLVRSRLGGGGGGGVSRRVRERDKAEERASCATRRFSQTSVRPCAEPVMMYAQPGGSVSTCSSPTCTPREGGAF